MGAPTLHRLEDPAAAVDALADWLLGRLALAIDDRGGARIALAGGGTPRPLYRTLARRPDALDWSRVQVFWGDERCVPADDPASNYRMARETLLEPLGLGPSSIHRIPGELPPDETAVAYARTLGDSPLDLVLLGLGGDGHTASIFPDTPVQVAAARAVLATRSPAPPIHRVTLGYGPINGARAVAFLALGSGKAGPVSRVIAQGRARTPVLPAAGVRRARGVLLGCVAGGAAAKLD